MSNWFDILYRRDEPAPPPVVTEDDPAPSAAAPAPETMTGANPRETNRHLLQPTSPLKGLPGRWALEVQKVVFHLHPENEPVPHRHLVFSGMQRQAGTTTICYLVAHHLATERADQRVLHVDFNSDRRRAAMAGTDLILTIGQPIPEAFFSAIPKTFTRIAIRPGDTHSVATTAGWVREFMTLAKQYCDWVFVDAPPFFVAPEAYGVAKCCDGVVLVLKSGESRYPALNGLVSDLDALGIKVIGTVLNFRQYPIPRWILKYI